MANKTNDTRRARPQHTQLNYNPHIRGEEREQAEREDAGGEGVRENSGRSGVARIIPTGQ